jgi:hypothetical protein
MGTQTKISEYMLLFRGTHWDKILSPEEIQRVMGPMERLHGTTDPTGEDQRRPPRKRSNAILISGRNSVLVYLERVRIRARSKCGQSDFADISLAEELTECLPEDSSLIGDKAYDSSTLRQGAGAKGIKTCIPARSNPPRQFL